MIIGIDVGTTSTKAVVFDDSGRTWASAKQGYPLTHPQPDRAEQDPAAILQAVVTTVQAVCHQVDPAKIEALALSTAMHSVMLLDHDHQPLTPLLTWADNRSAAITAAWQEAHVDLAHYQRTGTPNHPMTPLAKLRWWQMQQPVLYQQAHYIGDLKSYLCWQLSGHFQIDESLANATGLFNWQTGTWDQTLLTELQLEPQQLPQIVPITTQLLLTETVRQQLGLPATTPLVIGASDGALANLGLAATDHHQIALTIGTSGALRIISPQPHLDAAGQLFCYKLRADQWLIGGPVNNGGLVLEWAAATFAGLTTASSAPSQHDYQATLARASQSPAGAHGLLFYPYLNGERAPLWTADARGSLLGLTQQHNSADILRAVLEGITLNLRLVYQQIIALTGPVTAIHAAGGFARSPFWCQLVTDVFGQNVIVPAQVESSSLGAAIVGWQSLRADPTFTIPVQTTATYHPQAATQARYQELFTIWQQAGNVLKGQYHDIAAWQARLAKE